MEAGQTVLLAQITQLREWDIMIRASLGVLGLGHVDCPSDPLHRALDNREGTQPPLVFKNCAEPHQPNPGFPLVEQRNCRQRIYPYRLYTG